MFGFDECQAQVGHAVSFTATATFPFTFNWDFGDGSQATGRSVTHAWSKAGQVVMQLAASNGTQTAFQTKIFEVGSGPPPCVASATRLCLDGNRFQVDVTWTTPQGGSRPGQAVPPTHHAGYVRFVASTHAGMGLTVLGGSG